MKKRWLVAAALMAAATMVPAASAQSAPTTAPATQPEPDVYAAFNPGWAATPEWKQDGFTELAQYRTADELQAAPNKLTSMHLVATSLDKADPDTKNLAAPGRPSRGVFVQETLDTRGDLATWQTYVFVGAQDHKSLRVDATLVAPGGPVHRQLINHKGTLTWESFVTRRGMDAKRSGTYTPPRNLLYENAAPLALRAYPFAGDHLPIALSLIADQAAPNGPSPEPVPATLEYVGEETVRFDAPCRIENQFTTPRTSRPIEQVRAHHLILTPRGAGAAEARHYWFASDLDHVMVRSERGGKTLSLSSLVYARRSPATPTTAPAK